MWYKKSADVKQKRRVLPKGLRKKFINKQIMCVEYSGITEADERDIFRVRYQSFLDSKFKKLMSSGSSACKWE